MVSLSKTLKAERMPLLPSPPSVSALPSLCTSYSNRNLIFQAIVVFPLPYFYCCYCCCCLEDHRLPLYADFSPHTNPLLGACLSVSFCISICLTLTLMSFSLPQLSVLFSPPPFCSLLILLYFFTPFYPPPIVTTTSTHTRPLFLFFLSPLLPPASLLSVYLLFS